jgi:hypothetical protein
MDSQKTLLFSNSSLAQGFCECSTVAMEGLAFYSNQINIFNFHPITMLALQLCFPNYFFKNAILTNEFLNTNLRNHKRV